MNNIEHHIAHVNGLDLHYVAAGNGSSVVVLLHGFPEFWYSWRHQIAPLAETHRVIALDQRGYNTSSKPNGVKAYALPHLLNDITGLVNHLGVDKITIVGHDWGGSIAWLWAICHPEHTERLAVINLPHPALFLKALMLGNPRQMLRSWYMAFFQLPNLPERLMEGDSFKSIIDGFKAIGVTDAEIAEYVTAWQQPDVIPSMLNWYRAFFRYGIRWTNALPSLQVRVPTQLIWGTSDVALGQELTYGTERYVADLRIRYLPGVSHWAQQEAPDEVNKTLVPFVRGDC